MVAQRKPEVPITLSAVVSEDRRLVLDLSLPPTTPTGTVQVEVVVRPIEDVPITSARDRIRAKLVSAGALSTAHVLPEGVSRPNDEDVIRAGVLPPNARPSEDIIRDLRSDE